MAETGNLLVPVFCVRKCERGRTLFWCAPRQVDSEKNIKFFGCPVFCWATFLCCLQLFMILLRRLYPKPSLWPFICIIIDVFGNRLYQFLFGMIFPAIIHFPL